MSPTLETTDPASIRPVPHPSVETAFLAPEAVLFDDRHGEIHHLNPSASAVWLMVDGELSLVEIADELSEIFGLPAAELLPDVESIIADFRSRGLLEAGDTPRAESEAPDADDSEAVADAPQRIETLARPPDP